MKQQFKKKALVLAITGLIASGAFAQTNLGFEDGTTTGWTSSTLTAVGSTTTQAGPNTWVINPYGSYMGQLQIQTGQYSSMATALGLTSASSSAITTLLQQQAQTGGGNPNPTTAGWVTKEVTLTAGTTFTLAWQYISVDYVPFNDGSIATLTQNGTNAATVNNYNQQYALLGFTNPGTGDYSTGSYGATGWQVATFQVSVDGTYTLGFGVFNLGDTALSPVLYIDEVQGTTTLNGQTFGAVAPNNATAPSSPSVTPPPPTTPTTVSTVASGTTAGTDNLASAVTVNGGTIQISSNNIVLTNTFTTDANGMTVDQNGNTVDFSGVISGSGGVTIANTGTGGGVTFSAVNTYTGTTTVNSGASLTNTGTIAGAVTNLGAFTNTGTAGNVTNGFNGDGNTASLINSGTTGNVTNYSSFANSGTTGNVSNSGTFTNTGTSSTVNNSGVVNNNTGGVINELGYNNFIVQNSGTINTITYNGGNVVNNPNGTIGSITTTQAHGSFNNFGTVTGDVSTNATFNNYTGGTVQGNYTNDGTLNNAGTLNTVTNNSTFNNQSGGVVSGLTTNTGTLNNGGTLNGVTNTGTFTNNLVTGDVTNSGTFTNAGTAGAVTLVTGTFSNTGTVASVDNTAGLTVTNNGTVTGTVQNSGTFINDGSVGSTTNTGTFTNNNTVGSVDNSGTFVNSGTAGNVANTGDFTNTGSAGDVTMTSGTFNNTGTVASVDNTAGLTLTNNGTVTGLVANAGTFTNEGNVGSVNNTNTFINNNTVGTINTSGTFANNGTAGNVTNSGTFTNDGTTANVTNSNTFTNNGTTGSVTNTGWFTNALNAIVGFVSNSNIFTNNGTSGSVNNSGTFTNNGAAGTVDNSGTFTNVGTTGDVTNSGTFTNNGTTGNVSANQGTFNNNATVGQVSNEGTFNNAGTTSDVVNAGTFNNSGSTGPVTNNGTFNLTGNGTISSIANNGVIQAPAVFNATGSDSNVTVSSYSQNAFGSTAINGNQKIVVSGDATLGGDLHIVNVPTAYGRYQYLTASSVTGKYDTLTLNPDIYPLGYELAYTGSDVKLKVTPSAIHTQSSIDNVGSSLSSINNLQMANLGGSLGYDCNVYGENNLCVSMGARITADGSGNISAGSMVIGYRFSPYVRAGVFVNQATNNLTIGNVTQKNNQPLVGGFVNWNNNADGTGLGVQTSAAANNATLNITRNGTAYSETATGTTTSNGFAYQVKTTYNQPISNDTSITPYLGLRYTQLSTNGYTETGAVYPLTYNSVSQNTTDVIAGATLGHNFTDRFAGYVSAGVVQNISYNSGNLSGSSEIVRLNTFSTPLAGSQYTAPTVGVGASYALSKTEFIGLSAGWQEKSMLNTNIKSVTATYTVGF